MAPLSACYNDIFFSEPTWTNWNKLLTLVNFIGIGDFYVNPKLDVGARANNSIWLAEPQIPIVQNNLVDWNSNMFVKSFFLNQLHWNVFEWSSRKLTCAIVNTKYLIVINKFYIFFRVDEKLENSHHWKKV
jgi:hypothetical protein